MKCTRCQSELKEGDSFCMKCGAPFEWNKMSNNQVLYQQQPYQQLPYQQPQQQPYQQPLYQQSYQKNMYMTQNTGVSNGKKGKSKGKLVLISVLAIFLVFGIIGFIVGILGNKDEGTETGIVETGIVETEIAETEIVDKDKKAKHTIMIYMIGSDLETKNKMATLDIQEIMQAQYGEDIKVVVQTGGAKKWWTDGIEDGKVQRFELKTGEIIELDNLGKINMVEKRTLTNFIKFASEEYKAEKYTLVLWDHGGGIPIGFGKDENFDNENMTEAEVGLALKTADVQFECIVMDACNMCTLEVAMAVKEYSKYMVAAESYTAGTGMYYTSWLEHMGKNPDTVGAEYGELLVSDYMDSIDDDEKVVSMSSINLSKIDKVYATYIEYVESVYKKLKAGDYVNYAKARENSGLYKSTDSVDIITLATKYPTDKSDALITAVVNAVGHTESDYLYGHGIAVYSPHTYINYYEYARESIETLEYDKKTLEFYDAYVSVYLAYLGKDYVTQYAGKWYDETIVSQYVQGGTQSGEYQINTEVINGNTVINCENIDINTISSVEVDLYMFLDSDNVVVVGRNYYNEYDKDKNIIIDVPKKWIYINDYVAPYMCVSKYVDEESERWMELGTVFAKCNGEQILILIYFDNETPGGRIAGYMYYEYEEQKETEYGSSVFSFKDGDDIELIYPLLNKDSEDMLYQNVIGKHFDGSSLEIKYMSIDLSQSKVACTYAIYDIYGNTYETDMFMYN